MSSLFERYKIIKTIDSDESNTIYLVEEIETKSLFVLRKVFTDTSSPLYATAVKEFQKLGKESAKIDKTPGAPAIVDFFLEDHTSYLLMEYKDEKTIKKISLYPSIGKVLNNRYAVIRGIASGGFGVVYIVRDLNLSGKYWALKEMHDEGGVSEIMEKSFRGEAEILSSLEHPAIPAISDFFVEKEKLYLVMEYVKGDTLRKMLKNLKKGDFFSEDEVLSWALSLCDVLEYLHKRDEPVVFRDLKPDNIMITDEGNLKLIDFGIARVFQGPKAETTKYALLTEGYAPQEQWLGKAEPRSDVYSLGATLYHLITGVHPRKVAPHFPSIESVNPGVSPLLGKIIFKAMEPKITERYETIREMKEELLKLSNYKKGLVHMEKAGEYEHGGDFYNANFEYMKALELQGENVTLLTNIAGICEKMGFKGKAREYYRRALTISGTQEEENKIRDNLRLLGDEGDDEETIVSSGKTPAVTRSEEIEEKDLNTDGKSIAPDKKEEKKKGKKGFIQIAVITVLSFLIIALVAYTIVWWYCYFSPSMRLSGEGRDFYNEQRYDKALECFEAAIELDCEYPMPWVGKGKVLIAMKRYEEALACFERALKLDHKEFDAWNGKGLVFLYQGNYKEAAYCFDRSLEFKPGWSEACNNKGLVLMAQEKNDDAIKYFDLAIKDDPEYGEALYNKALILKQKGNYPDAITLFDKALAGEAFDKKAGAWYNKGKILYIEGKPDEALGCFDEALRFESEYTPALTEKGNILLGHEKYDEALACYDKVLEYTPGDNVAWYNKGVVLYEKEKFEEALKCFNKSIELDPDYGEALQMKDKTIRSLGK